MAQQYTILTTFLDIAMTDGRRLSARTDFAKGSPALPMSEDAGAEKFCECSEFANWPAQHTEKLIELIVRLEELDDARALMG